MCMIICYSELDLSWDPLADRYHLMDLAERSLLSCHFPHTVTTHTHSRGKEEFPKYTLSHDNDDDDGAERPLSELTNESSGWRREPNRCMYCEPKHWFNIYTVFPWISPSSSIRTSLLAEINSTRRNYSRKYSIYMTLELT